MNMYNVNIIVKRLPLTGTNPRVDKNLEYDEGRISKLGEERNEIVRKSYPETGGNVGEGRMMFLIPTRYNTNFIRTLDLTV